MIVKKKEIFTNNYEIYDLNYTIQIEHLQYGGNFTVENVNREVMRLNDALVNAYNST